MNNKRLSKMSDGWYCPLRLIKKDRRMRKKVGDYLLDVSKLIFAGVVLSSILDFRASLKTQSSR
ncbi:MAG: DUF6722 family protein [Candidatus Desantisbacteria bacterium]